MKKRLIKHLAYWILILLFLTAFFGYNWKSHTTAFYFSIFLLPVVIATTYFFNFWLVPNYLLKSKYGKFALYFFYMLVVSLYLEMVVTLISFVVIANYNMEVMNLESISIFILGINLYLIVFATSFIRLVVQFRKKSLQLDTLKTQQEKNQQAVINIRADRKNHQVILDDLLYIESLSDYVKIVTTEEELITREKISKLHSDLPDQFIRIHRSFVINKRKVQSFTNTELTINNTSIPISRTYKKSTIEELQDQ
ncbi:LytR/AlgR family response regulator transcription factor [Mangrovivirga cuniculi]|uniref:HTH LytTR-type domain-containing protein n=1 Tax=Mangrovivirga cuniculi TaxID=2715131 RepID=A0A4D7JKK6_9BACT|nr:LytTR family DNA-binding domain-containing protein [Mangrovivirga cuniculi]QCK16131.1 hypothetical protein DCC35_15980 [Mangrovivirga cuniculi]